MMPPYEKTKRLGKRYSDPGMADAWRAILRSEVLDLRARKRFGRVCHLFHDLEREPAVALRLTTAKQATALAAHMAATPKQGETLKRLTVSESAATSAEKLACLAAVPAASLRLRFACLIEQPPQLDCLLAALRLPSTSEVAVDGLKISVANRTFVQALADAANLLRIGYLKLAMKPSSSPPLIGNLLSVVRSTEIHVCCEMVSPDAVSAVVSIVGLSVAANPHMRRLHVDLPRDGSADNTLRGLFLHSRPFTLDGLFMERFAMPSPTPPAAVAINHALAASLASVVSVRGHLVLDFRTVMWPADALLAVERLLATGVTEFRLGCTAIEDGAGGAAERMLHMPLSVAKAALILPASVMWRAMKHADMAGVTSLHMWSCPACGVGASCSWSGHRAECCAPHEAEAEAEAEALRTMLIAAPALKKLRLQVCGDARLLLGLANVLAASGGTLTHVILHFKMAASCSECVLRAARADASRVFEGRAGFTVDVDAIRDSPTITSFYARQGRDPVILF